jgi:hypothetical protein
MPYESDQPVFEGRWDVLLFRAGISLPRDITVLLQARLIVLTSDATFQPTSTKVDANGRFTLRLTSSLMPPGVVLELRGQYSILHPRALPEVRAIDRRRGLS